MFGIPTAAIDFQPHAIHAKTMPPNQYKFAVLRIYDKEEGRHKTILSNPNTVHISSTGQKLSFRGRNYVIDDFGQLRRLN